MTKRAASLFFTALLQVSLVTATTYFIAHGHFTAAVMVSFAISYVWSGNVKRLAFGTRADRVIYAAGAATGTLVGLVLATLFYGIII